MAKVTQLNYQLSCIPFCFLDDSRFVVDSYSAGFDPWLVLTDADVSTAANSGDLQLALVLVIGVSYPWFIPWGQLFGT